MMPGAPDGSVGRLDQMTYSASLTGTRGDNVAGEEAWVDDGNTGEAIAPCGTAGDGGEDTEGGLDASNWISDFSGVSCLVMVSAGWSASGFGVSSLGEGSAESPCEDGWLNAEESWVSIESCFGRGERGC